MKKMNTRSLTMGALLTAAAFVLSYVELLIPFSVGIPGIKLGFANIIILYTLYKFGWRFALIVNMDRIILAGLLFGSPFSTLYSLCGGLLSLAVMAWLKELKIFSTAGVSMAGGVFHNLGQLIAAVLVVKTRQVLLYFPVLLFSGMAAGIVNGIIVTLCLKRTDVKPNR